MTISTNWICYEDNGEIKFLIEGDEADAKINASNYISGTADINTQYMLNHVVTDKPVNPTTINSNTLSNVPSGSDIWINNDFFENVAAGEHTIELASSNIPIKINVRVFPYLDWNYERT
jgi:hypothetical protein